MSLSHELDNNIKKVDVAGNSWSLGVLPSKHEMLALRLVFAGQFFWIQVVQAGICRSAAFFSSELITTINFFYSVTLVVEVSCCFLTSVGMQSLIYDQITERINQSLID